MTCQVRIPRPARMSSGPRKARQIARTSGPGRARLRGDGQEELLDDLLELERVGGEVAHRHLELLGGGADEGAAAGGTDLVGHPLVEALELLVGVLQALRVHVAVSPWVAAELEGEVDEPLDLR